MKKTLWLVGFFLCLFNSLKAQVGINTIDPKAQLDIVSSDPLYPQVTDGILIPRIANFPAILPTADQDGMLVYLKNEKTGFPKGFYYWESSLSAWTSITSHSLYNFYKEGTTEPSTGIIDGIYRMGNIGIGEESPEVRLKVILPPELDHSIRTGFEVDNSSSSPQNVTYSILSNNRSITSSRKYGIKNNVSAAGKGVHYGIYNEVYQSSVEDMYGIYNKVGRTYGATKNHYGIYTEIGTPEGSGMTYGIFSTAFGNNPERVFAGYFAGRLGIGSSFEKNFVFPVERGNTGQILSLNETGVLGWTSLNSKTFTSTGTATGSFVIPEETFTLRINEQVTSVNIPSASLHRGRILILLGWNGISTKTLNLSSGEDIWDNITGSSINSISGGERLTIQSDGNRWVVLSRQ